MGPRLSAVELRHVRSFLVLADELHFGRAASLIPLAQPALSHHIKQLEREVGARLFDRDGRHVRLTPAGELFLPHARATLRHAQNAVTAVRDQVSGVTGHLRVGVLGGVADLSVPVLRSFQVARPGVQLSVVELDVLQQSSELAEHRIDVAMVRSPIDDHRVAVLPLVTEPRVAVVPVTHPMAGSPMLMLDDIIDDPVLAAHPEEPRIWTDYWRVSHRRSQPPREVGPADARTVVGWLHALAVRDCVSTTGASTARSYPFPGLRFIPLADVDACEIAVALRSDESDPLAAFFVATARRHARDVAGLLRGATPITGNAG